MKARAISPGTPRLRILHKDPPASPKEEPSRPQEHALGSAITKTETNGRTHFALRWRGTEDGIEAGVHSFPIVPCLPARYEPLWNQLEAGEWRVLFVGQVRSLVWHLVSRKQFPLSSDCWVAVVAPTRRICWCTSTIHIHTNDLRLIAKLTPLAAERGIIVPRPHCEL